MIRKLLVLRDPELVARELRSKTRRKQLPSSSLPQEPAAISTDCDQNSAILEQVTQAKHKAETEAIVSALNATRWNRKRAAAILKIDYKALLYKMKKLGVEDAVVRLPSKGRAEAPPETSAACLG